MLNLPDEKESLSLLYREIEKRNYIITTAELVEFGYHKLRIAELVENRQLLKLGHGLYTIPDEIYDPFFYLTKVSKHIVFSHETALYLHGLEKNMPEFINVTIPADASVGKQIKKSCTCFYIKPELYGIGLTEIMTKKGNVVPVYNPERTICDLMRSRGRIGNEIVVHALKQYMAMPEKNLKKLTQYAALFRVIKTLDLYMDLLF